MSEQYQRQKLSTHGCDCDEGAISQGRRADSLSWKGKRRDSPPEPPGKNAAQLTSGF